MQISGIDAILQLATGVMGRGTLFQRAKRSGLRMIVTAARSRAGEIGTGMANPVWLPVLRARDGGPDQTIGATFQPGRPVDNHGNSIFIHNFS
jgi:hypothetical protein